MRKALSLFACLLMLVSVLSACGNSNSGTETPNDSTETPSAAGTEAPPVDNDEDPYEVVLQIVTFGQNYRDIPAIEEAINEITVPAINCTVSILNTGIGDLNQKNSMMTASGEKIDLMLVGLTTKMPGLVSEGILLPLDDLVAQYGQDLTNLFGDLMEAGKMNGALYAVPADPYPAMGGAFVYNKAVAEELNIQLPEFGCTFEDLEAAFEIIKESDYDMYGFSNGLANGTALFYFEPVLSFGDNLNMSYGVIFDPANGTEVQNYYASDEYYSYLVRMKEWVDKGYMPPNALTNGIEAQDLMKAQAIFGLGTSYDMSQQQVWNNNMGYETALVQTVAPMIATETVQEVMWGVPVTCERPEKAIQFLNYFYSDEGTPVANLLANGLEGVNYQKVSDSVITFADGVDTNDLGYQRIFSRFGNTVNVLQWEPATEDNATLLLELNENALMSSLMGYNFDAEPVTVEIAAIVNVISEYCPALESGIVDIDTVLPDFIAALETAGYEKVIAENQRQLDAWLANQ